MVADTQSTCDTWLTNALWSNIYNKLKIYTFRLHNMGCGSSSHPVAGSSDEGLDNDVNDPNKQTKSGKD